MFNSSGAVEEVVIHLASDKKSELFDGEVPSEFTTSLADNRSSTATIAIKTRGCGRFGAYSSQRPLKCTIDKAETEFEYDSATGLLTVTIPIPTKEMYKWLVEIHF